MTTIVCTKEEMVADSQITHNGLVTKECKLFKTDRGIIGTAGDSQDGLAFIDWIKGGDKPEDISEEFEALILTREGKMFWYGKRLIPEPITSPFYSIGSGSHIAIGAMEMGATPEEAVKIACKWTNESSIPVKKVSI